MFVYIANTREKCEIHSEKFSEKKANTKCFAFIARRGNEVLLFASDCEIESVALLTSPSNRAFHKRSRVRNERDILSRESRYAYTRYDHGHKIMGEGRTR